jgi:hypothetical protein
MLVVRHIYLAIHFIFGALILAPLSNLNSLVHFVWVTFTRPREKRQGSLFGVEIGIFLALKLVCCHPFATFYWRQCNDDGLERQ